MSAPHPMSPPPILTIVEDDREVLDALRREIERTGSIAADPWLMFANPWHDEPIPTGRMNWETYEAHIEARLFKPPPDYTPRRFSSAALYRGWRDYLTEDERIEVLDKMLEEATGRSCPAKREERP